jgi:hypothetical protein
MQQSETGHLVAAVAAALTRAEDADAPARLKALEDLHSRLQQELDGAEPDGESDP